MTRNLKIIAVALLSTVLFSCGKDEDKDEIVNADLSGDYEGVLSVDDVDTSYNFVTVMSFMKESGNKFLLSNDGEALGSVATKGNTFSGTGNDLTGIEQLKGSISGKSLTMTATLEGGGKATFAGEKITGGGGGGGTGSDITINGQKFVLNQLQCDTETMAGIYQQSGNQLEVANVVLIFESAPQAGTYEVNKDSLPSSSIINASVMYQLETKYGSSGTVTVTGSGSNVTATLSNIVFDFDVLSQSTVTPVKVIGTLTCK